MRSFKTTTAWDGRANIFSSPLCKVTLFTVEVKYHRDCLVLQANENRRRGSSDTITNIYYSGGSTSTRPGHETIYVDNEREAILNEKLDTDEFLPAMHSWQPLPQVVAKKNYSQTGSSGGEYHQNEGVNEDSICRHEYPNWRQV
jgi:hypothetical protein